MSNLNDYEKKIYSQHGEDGIIDYIFSKIGTTNKNFVEFGFTEGKGRIEFNSAHLLIDKGWEGILIDANKGNIGKDTVLIKDKIGKSINNTLILNYLLTRDNVNSIFIKNRKSFEIDMLSIDIDGNDYWIWEEITTLNPRVVIIEYNAHFGNEKCITVEYDPHFNRHKKHFSKAYFGASLPALEKLGCSKGYYLVGVDNSGVNAFFLRKDILHDDLQKQTAKDCWKPFIKERKGVEDMLSQMKFVEV